MKRVFVDSGVLIAAARGNADRTERALTKLSEVDQIFLSSILIKLEVLPKAIHHKQQVEIDFYEFFFGNVTDWVVDLEPLIHSAYELADTYGLSGLDALNIAAAIVLNADEFVTTEKPQNPCIEFPIFSLFASNSILRSVQQS